MKPVEIKVEGYEVLQASCNKEGEINWQPITWAGKKVLLILLEPKEDEE